MKRNKPHKYTDEQIEYFVANHEMKTAQEFANEFNDVFGTNLSKSQIKSYRNNNKLHAGFSGQFVKGQVSFNKGRKQSEWMSQEQIEKTKATRFQKGDVPSNYKEVGSERICKKDGYVLIKVTDDGAWNDRWKRKHRIVWEQEHGPIPKGHMLTFKDGNKLNVELDNLMLITQRENAIINKRALRSEHEELNEVGINVGRVISKVFEKKENSDD